jgi:hypothetical protein
MSLVAKESVADRVRKFKESLAQRKRTPKENIEPTQDDLTSISACSSIDDIFTVLRSRATKVLPDAGSSLDSIRFHEVSLVLQDLRAGQSETCVEHKREICKEPPEDPMVVISRIKQRLKNPNDSKLSVVHSENVITQTLAPRNRVASNPLVAIHPRQYVDCPAQADDSEPNSRQFCDSTVQSDVSHSDMSVCCYPVVAVTPCLVDSTSCPEESSAIPSLPLSANWRLFIEKEILRTRESILNRINT